MGGRLPNRLLPLVNREADFLIGKYFGFGIYKNGRYINIFHIAFPLSFYFPYFLALVLHLGATLASPAFFGPFLT